MKTGEPWYGTVQRLHGDEPPALLMTQVAPGMVSLQINMMLPKETAAEIKRLIAAYDARDALSDVMRAYQLQRQDVDIALELATLLRARRFDDFLAKLQPYIEQARRYTGRLLPDDLADEVRAGCLSPERATELAALRIASAPARSRPS